MSGIRLSEYEYEVACREALWSSVGLGWVSYWRLLKIFGSGKAVWEAKKEVVLGVGLPERAEKAFLKRHNSLDIPKRWLCFEKRGVKVLALGLDEGMIKEGEAKYPSWLAGVEKAPPILYVLGNIIDHDQKALGVVGTRKPTEYGINITQQLVYDLVSSGFTIVSGLARGIDGVAHRAALEAGGRTIGVLGSGIDQITPREHEELGRNMTRRGAVVSMFWPGEPSFKGNFVQRNRIIAGLSLGILVTEAAEKSGTQITVDYAIDQDKPIFAVPGMVTSAMSKGALSMLKSGATLVTSGKDVAEALGVVGVKGVKNGFLEKSEPMINDELQKMIWEVVKNEEQTASKIGQKLGVGAEEVNVALTMMEMEGWVAQVNGVYGRRS